MKRLVVLPVALIASCVLFSGGIHAQKQKLPKEKITLQEGLAIMKIKVNMKSFASIPSMKLREGLAILHDKLRANKKKFPVVLDEKRFSAENPDAPRVSDTEISFLKAPKSMTVFEIMQFMISKIPYKNGTFIYHNGYVLITTKDAAKLLRK